MKRMNCWCETRSALVISVVLEGVHPKTILSCTSYEVVSLLICMDKSQKRGEPGNSRREKEMRRHLKTRNASRLRTAEWVFRSCKGANHSSGGSSSYVWILP